MFGRKQKVSNHVMVVCQKLRLINYAEKFMQAQAGGRWCHWVIVLVWAPFYQCIVSRLTKKTHSLFFRVGL